LSARIPEKIPPYYGASFLVPQAEQLRAEGLVPSAEELMADKLFRKEYA